MRTAKWTVLLMGAALALPIVAAQKDPRAEARLQAAINKETVEGDLKGAIDLYSKLVQSPNRTVAATALVRMGQCHEKLGSAEAQKAYERVVREYADQAEQVKLARARLVMLRNSVAVAAQKPTLRRISIPTLRQYGQFASGMLSPDGQQLAFLSEGSLWVVPVHGRSDPNVSGSPVRLTKPMGAEDVANLGIAWSSDGKRIVFRAGSEMYLIPASGGEPKKLPLKRGPLGGDPYSLRFSLAPNADRLALVEGSKTLDLRVITMPLGGGEQVQVTKPPAREPAFSPDGTKIAYVKLADSDDLGGTGRQIWAVTADGRNQLLVCEVPEPNRVHSPIWSPDGTMIAFAFSRSGNNYGQIWIVPLFDQGKRAGLPLKIDLPRTHVNFLSGWTRGNKIGVLLPSPQYIDLYTVPTSGGKAVQITPGPKPGSVDWANRAYMPSWSRDGKSIYFQGTHTADRAKVEVVPAAGGKVDRVAMQPESLQVAYPSGGLSVSPDGRTLCFAGAYPPARGQEFRTHLFTVPVEGGKANQLTEDYSVLNPTWSPDGKQIAFVRHEESGRNIFVLPAGGGDARRITTPDDKVAGYAMRWAPDGALIAYFAGDRTLRVVPAAGGASRVLVPKIGGGILWFGLSWSPDGKRLAFVSEGKLWQVRREGGEPQPIATGLDAIHMRIDWSPDGNTIAFNANRGGEHELWLVEDFVHRVTEPR